MQVTVSKGSVAALIISLIAGGIVLGVYRDPNSRVSAFPEQTTFTFVHGFISSTFSIPAPLTFVFVSIFFDGSDGSTLSSGVTSTSTGYLYQLFLKSDVTYSVRVYYFESRAFSDFNTIQSCPGIPYAITPTGPDYPQNFRC